MMYGIFKAHFVPSDNINQLIETEKFETKLTSKSDHPRVMLKTLFFEGCYQERQSLSVRN